MACPTLRGFNAKLLATAGAEYPRPQDVVPELLPGQHVEV